MHVDVAIWGVEIKYTNMLKREEFLDHTQGDVNCEYCWGWGPHKKCECGGVVHSEFEEESYDSVFLTYECDACNSRENPN